MTRAATVRAVLAAAVLLVSVLITLTMSPRLGLDLQGGTRIVLQTKDSDTAKADRESTERTLEVLRGRIDSLGVAEPSLTRSGENRIIVELPDVQDPRQAAEVIGRTAQLSFHAVQGPGTEQKDDAPRTGLTLPDEQGTLLALGPVQLDGAGVKDATAAFDAQQGTGWSVSLDFHEDAGRKWTGLTGEAACNPPQDERRRVAIVLDGKVISSPQVDPSIGCKAGLPSGSTQITGSFSADEARDLALLIKGAHFPSPSRSPSSGPSVRRSGPLPSTPAPGRRSSARRPPRSSSPSCTGSSAPSPPSPSRPTVSSPTRLSSHSASP